MLRLFNTRTRKIGVFKSIKDKEVNIYTCGPTVYDYAHIGNLRAYICADILKRYLKYKGYNVKHVMNITDVDDKTIKGSQQQGISLKKYTQNFSNMFFEDIKILNLDLPDIFPKATEHIPEMIMLIKKLLKKGFAYKGEDGSIYYDISKFKNYGKLAQLDMDGLKEGARIRHDEYSKDSPKDFCLWKACDKDDGDVFWKTELGKGRPGWHIECSAMNMKYLGEEFDIHTGGVDLIFPHHENEIAQSVGATGKEFVHYWFHNEHLLVNGKKMSKSLGNFYTLRDLLNKGYNPIGIRYLLLSTHYRQQLNFTEESLQGAENSVQRINDFILKLRNVSKNALKNKTTLLTKKVQNNF
ncbi:MAG: cysteine--tRNA ligase, partial [Nanoarchaeota archaeon]